MIQNHHYFQLYDYFSQLINLSEQDGLPKINQTKIVELLGGLASTMSRFMNGKLKKPKVMLNNFIDKYPSEFKCWPQGKNTIERVLAAADARFFLNLPQQQLMPPRLPLPVPTLQVQLRPLLPTIYGTNYPHLFTAASTQPSPMAFAVFPAPLSPHAIGPFDLRHTADTQVRYTPPRQINQGANKVLSPLQRLCRRQIVQVAISISYRGHESDKDGKGMLFDHMRIQDATKFPTQLLLPTDHAVAAVVKKLFLQELNSHTAQLLVGQLNDKGRREPAYTFECCAAGLLLIPGRVHKVEDEAIRLAHEYKIIRQALNRGQPILGICAGVWRIFEQCFIWTKAPDWMNKTPSTLLSWHQTHATLINVHDHAYCGGMIRLSKNGVQASYNKDIHDVEVAPGSMLGIAFKSRNGLLVNRLPVNSVHWKAVNPNQLPDNIAISAVAKMNPNIAINMRKPERLMVPDKDTAEAFESVFGAPIMGIQWHPEGYESATPHGQLLRYMAQAGSAYAAKRKMLVEFTAKHHAVKG
jgi:gamma-glutamyl-gamma-aminobutyrate hydrolase PuuD